MTMAYLEITLQMPRKRLDVADVGWHHGRIERAQTRSVMRKVGVPGGDNGWHRRV
jgi:hypothetical protein